MNSKTTTPNRVLNAIPSQGKETDWKFEKAIEDGLITKDYPESFDLREEDWWSVGDQGYTSSCIGWASTDGMLRWHLVKANKIDKNDKLSVRFIWMAAKETDNNVEYPETFIESSGTPMKPAMEVMRKFGCVHEKELEFNKGFASSDHTTESFFSLAAELKIKAYYCLQYDEIFDLDRFKKWIFNVGPVLAMVDLDQNFWNPYTDKTALVNEYDKDNQKGGHAVVLVGYTKDHFIVRNSWGAEYGDNGYAYVSNAYMQAAFCEAYGITV